jgi:septum formation protein
MMPSTNLILGSQSPRRKELLQQAGFSFDVHTVDFDESYPKGMENKEVAEYIANSKNRALRELHSDSTIVTADTIVISNKKILGKPKDEADATKMLSLLSGNSHKVITGVCVSNGNNHSAFSSTTSVKVKALSIKEINYYLSNFQPFDKAGAYGIQEWFGLIAIERIKGSYYNVVGMPIDKVYKALVNEFGITPTY